MVNLFFSCYLEGYFYSKVCLRLNTIVMKENKELSHDNDLDQLVGCIKRYRKDFDYKKIKSDYLAEKYLGGRGV